MAGRAEAASRPGERAPPVSPYPWRRLAAVVVGRRRSPPPPQAGPTRASSMRARGEPQAADVDAGDVQTRLVPTPDGSSKRAMLSWSSGRRVSRVSSRSRIA